MDLTLRELNETDSYMLLQAYNFRFQYYSKFVQYPVVKNIELDIDPYDQLIYKQWGIYDGERIILYHRMIRRPNVFMFENEYNKMFCDVKIPTSEECCEVSRLTISPDYTRRRIESPLRLATVAGLSYRKIYQICKKNDIRYTYTCTFSNMIRAGSIVYKIPVQEITTRKMPDGEVLSLVVIDWEEFESFNKDNNILLGWYGSEHE